MKTSSYKSYDKLPPLLNAKAVAKVPGMSPSSEYELIHEARFPYSKSAIAWWYQRRSL